MKDLLVGPARYRRALRFGRDLGRVPCRVVRVPGGSIGRIGSLVRLWECWPDSGLRTGRFLRGELDVLGGAFVVVDLEACEVDEDE